MDNKKDDGYYIKKVIENIDAIKRYTNDLTYEEFVTDEMLIDAVLFRLVQMVENINHISDGFKNKHNKISWGQISGFRNGIVHNYGKTDYSIVYEIVSQDIDELRNELCMPNID